MHENNKNINDFSPSSAKLPNLEAQRLAHHYVQDNLPRDSTMNLNSNRTLDLTLDPNGSHKS